MRASVVAAIRWPGARAAARRRGHGRPERRALTRARQLRTTWPAAALVAASLLGAAAFFLYWSTLPIEGVDEASDGWSFGPPLAHPWRYGVAVVFGLTASASLLVGLVGVLAVAHPAQAARAGVWIAIVGAGGLLVAAIFQVYLVVLVATRDIPELILANDRVEVAYLIAVLVAMTGLVLGFGLAAVGLARARHVSWWAALALGSSSVAVAFLSLYSIPIAAASLTWLAVELARRGRTGISP